MISDGNEYEHDLTKRQHYDQLWAALTGAGLKMIGEHEFPGGTYGIYQRDTRLGTAHLTMTQKPEFAGGVWFGEPVLPGRTRNRAQALADFIDEVHTTHPGRVR